MPHIYTKYSVTTHSLLDKLLNQVKLINQNRENIKNVTTIWGSELTKHWDPGILDPEEGFKK